MPADGVTSILLVVSTATVKDAGSDMFFELIIPELASTESPAPTAPGDTGIYTLQANGSKTIDQISPTDITISADMPNGDNAWLPASLYLLAKTDTSDYQLVCGIPQWPSQIWISEDQSAHTLPPAFPAISLQNVLDARNPF
ncbi:hypothetical protein [Marinobacter sp. BGYM27]|uniref:hypothetical protein n=1 Tax=Marinobacter sp. BGYM27 TaxID=2975597 RepID=UPI0021A76EB9|nr:hypothetical protein [Marinobacter sp. BGYM27]MDG5499484.1 hypothetical protein [Marinobacter sp. BGYM27]